MNYNISVRSLAKILLSLQYQKIVVNNFVLLVLVNNEYWIMYKMQATAVANLFFFRRLLFIVLG